MRCRYATENVNKLLVGNKSDLVSKKVWNERFGAIFRWAGSFFRAWIFGSMAVAEGFFV